MKAINAMVENNEPHDTVMERILSGKDFKSKLENFVVVGKRSYLERYFQTGTVLGSTLFTGTYAKWYFPWTLFSVNFAHMKNIFVNPDFGKEGLHSKKKHFELNCILSYVLTIFHCF